MLSCSLIGCLQYSSIFYISCYIMLHLYMFQYHVYNIYLICILILFNGIQLHIITVVIICKYICQYLSLFFYIWDAPGISGPPTGEKSLYKMHHPGPYKTSQWEGLANNLEESIYSILQGASKMWNLQVPSPEFTGALGAASTCPAEGTPSSPPGSCI